MRAMFRTTLQLAALAVTLAAGTQASADPARDAIIAGYAGQPGVTALSADAGKAFFQAQHSGGKPDTPSCTTCHGSNPMSVGKARTGKAIEPMAVSANPGRFTDAAKVEKWFRRNCTSVLGRECTAQEKGDVLTYLTNL